MKLTTTLDLLSQAETCESGLKILLNNIGHDYDFKKPINLLTILESNGIDHFFWAFRALEQRWMEVRPILIKIVTEIAESVLNRFEEEYPNDDRPRKAIDAAKSAAGASYVAVKAAAANAAYSEYSEKAAAAYSACAAAHAAYAAENSAANAEAERQKQIDIIKKYLTWD